MDKFSRWQIQDIFFIFSQKTGLDISLETICMECQSLFSGEKKKVQIIIWNFYPEC